MKEWDHVHKVNVRYGGTILTIRSWAVTLFSAIFVVAVQQNSPFIFLFGIAPMIIFWFFDATYQGLQRIFREREYRIEDCLSRFNNDVLNDELIPNIGREFQGQNILNQYIAGSIFSQTRLAMYGSMIILLVSSFIILSAMN